MWKRMTSLVSIAPDRAALDAARSDRRPRVLTAGFASLYRYLENRYADVVVLTFGQIEDLLGFALPPLARTQPAWWTRDETDVDGPLSDAWTLAGRTATPNLQAKTVLFERTRV